MKIALSAESMSYLSTAPLYYYELAKQLRREQHEVVLFSDFHDPQPGRSGRMLADKLKVLGVELVQFNSDRTIIPETVTMPDADLLIASGASSIPVLGFYSGKCVTVNVLLTTYDKPIAGADHYVATTNALKEHITTAYNFRGENRILKISQGIDRSRFNVQAREYFRKTRDYSVTLVPCTLDAQREGFIARLIREATPENRVIIMGRNRGLGLLPENPNAKILPDAFNIEKYIGGADKVAGLGFGRVHQEACAMGIASYIYNPADLTSDILLPEFKESWDIVNVSKSLLKLTNISG